MNSRLFKERTILFTLYGVTACGCLVLAIILATVFTRGAFALSIHFLFEEARNFGLEGGIFYQIVGTVILMTGAVVVCLPVALGSVLFQTEFLHSPQLKKIFRLLIYSLNAVPTILFGLIGYLFFAQVPEIWIWVGAVTIFLAVFYNAYHERSGAP